jgi:protoheme IX farnesyltransferase
VNLITSVIGAVTLVSYLFIYTPLKRVTWANTLVGAIPGALPPLMGWTAARGELSGEGWTLFAILFFWQLPHFFAIAWMYRDDYAKAVSNTLALLVVSLCPFVFKMAGPAYLAGAIILGAGFLWCAVQFSRQLTPARARQLFFASIIYLPLLLAVMVWDKVK